jgi:hypothetical protein
MGGSGTVGRRGARRRHGRRRTRGLSRTHPFAGRQWRHQSAITRRMNCPARTGGAHSRLVSGAWWLSLGTARPGPALAPSTVGCPANRGRGHLPGRGLPATGAGVWTRAPGAPMPPRGIRCSEGFRWSEGPRISQRLWVARSTRVSRGTGASGRAHVSLSPGFFRPAGIPGYVEQAARRIHAGRLQDARPGRTLPRAVPGIGAAIAHPGRLLTFLAAPAAEREDHQHNHAEGDTRRAYLQP